MAEQTGETEQTEVEEVAGRRAAPADAALESRKLRSDANLEFCSSSSLYNVFFWVLALIIMLSVCMCVCVSI